MRQRPVAVAYEGACGGIVATIAMTAVTLAAQGVGLLGGQPPARITGALLDALGVQRRRGAVLGLSTTLLHLGFGASAGSVFALLHRSLRLPLSPAVQGAVYGGLVWVASYAGWIPTLGILPPPARDRPGRPTAMVVAHGVYGAVLGAFVGYRSRHGQG